MMNAFLRSVLVLSVLGLSASAFAVPLAPRHYLENATTSVSSFQGYNFDGVIALSNCSGSLVRFQTSQADDKAMVLTNGHCLANSMGGGMPKPGVVIVDQPVSRSLYVLNPVDGNKIGSIQATKILYATMTKTDMTLYEVSETYREIETKFSVHAFTLADRYPSVGEGIEIVSGYWRRGYGCKVDGIVNELREAGWTMFDSIRYSRPGCETIGGTSGSPIISTGSREIVGVNNTGNESGQKCTMNNPCEVDANGTITFEKGLSYGQQTTWVYGCLTSDRKIDLNLADCKLAKPTAAETPRKPSSNWPSKNR